MNMQRENNLPAILKLILHEFWYIACFAQSYINKIKNGNFSGSSMSGMTSLVQAAGVI